MVLRELQVQGLDLLIGRNYSAGYELQWLRESFKNSIEAGATEIVAGLERAFLTGNNPSYRYSVADNGVGMTASELEAFITRYGASGKRQGVLEGNYGVGLKSSALPWNPAGLVVISVRDGEDGMVWLERDAKGKYGVRVWDYSDGESGVVVEPVGIGFEWRSVLAGAQAGPNPLFGSFDVGSERWLLPDGTPAHGTVVVFYGSKENPDTYFGDPSRNEMPGRQSGWRRPHADFDYLAQRVWRLPDGVTLRTRFFSSADPSEWPGRGEALIDATVEVRKVNGALAGILGEDLAADSRPTVLTGELKVGAATCPATVRWYLRDRPLEESERRRPGVPLEGYVAAVLDDEVYDKGGYIRHRAFGVLAPGVRQRLFIIVEPQEYDGRSGSIGAHTDDARSRLRWSSPAGVSRDLPWSQWGEEFSRSLAPGHPVFDAIKAEQAAQQVRGGELPEEMVRRIAARLQDRLRISRLVEDPQGTEPGVRTDSGAGGRRRQVRKPKSATAPGGGGTGVGTDSGGEDLEPQVGGPERGTLRRRAIGLPTPEWRPADWFEAPWVFAQYDAASSTVSLNQDHRLLDDVSTYWRDRCVDTADEGALRHIIMEEYASSAVARIGQITANGKDLFGEDPTAVKEKMLSDEALTASLMGLLPEEDRIRSRISGRGWLHRGA